MKKLIASKKTSQATEKSASWDNPLTEFKINLASAQTVAVAGTFNGWDPSRTPLRNAGGGVWRVFLALKPGKHKYRYVVDGKWQEDPAAKEFATNPFGGHDSVLTVAVATRREGPIELAA